MKGRITEYKPAESRGTIAAFDTMRYGFSRADWQSAGEPAVGLDVDFRVGGASAREVVLRQAGANQSAPSSTRGAGAAVQRQPQRAELESTWAVVAGDTDFGEAVSTCFRKSLTFSGRARRAEFWYFALFGLILNIALMIVWSLIGGDLQNWHYAQTALRIALFLPSLAVLVRRLHDRDHSAYWVAAIYGVGFAGILPSLIGYEPPSFTPSIYTTTLLLVIGAGWIGILIWVFVQTVMAGTLGPNRYGTDPLSPLEKPS